METERVNRLQELSKGSEILNTDPPSINLAELMRQTDKEIQPKTWEIYIRKKIGTDIEIIKKFTWDEQGGKVSVVDRRGNELKTSQYSFQDGEMNLGEGYLQVEMPHDYRSYIEDIEMTGLDHYGRPSTSPGLAEEFDSWMSEVKSAEPQPSEFVQPESQEIQQSGSEELQNALFENEKLTSEIEERDRQLSAKDQQIAGLQKELNESNAKINNLEVAVKGLQDQMAEQTRQAEEERKKQEERLQILVEDALAKEREKDGEESENPDNLPEPESPISVQTESEVSSEAIDEQVTDEESNPQELSPGEVVILGKLADIEGSVNTLSGRVDKQQEQLDEMPSIMAGIAIKASGSGSGNGTSQTELVPSSEPIGYEAGVAILEHDEPGVNGNGTGELPEGVVAVTVYKRGNRFISRESVFQKQGETLVNGVSSNGSGKETNGNKPIYKKMVLNKGQIGLTMSPSADKRLKPADISPIAEDHSLSESVRGAMLTELAVNKSRRSRKKTDEEDPIFVSVRDYSA